MHTNLKILSLAFVIASTMIGRASAMQDDFLSDLNTTYPVTYSKIASYIDETHKNNIPSDEQGRLYLPLRVENRDYKLWLDFDPQVGLLFDFPDEQVDVTPCKYDGADFRVFTPADRQACSLTSTFRIKFLGNK